MMRRSVIQARKRLLQTRKAASNIRQFSTPSAVVKISHADLLAGKDLSAQIDEAFNYHGFGLIAIEGVPELMEKRQRLLKIGHTFGTLESKVRDQYEHEKSYFSVGWSHGKELFQGVPDYSKGSWYANPLIEAPTTDAELIDKYPSYFTANLWPNELPDMKPAFQDLGRLIMSTGQVLAKHCDGFVSSQCDSYIPQLENIIKDSQVPKGRLLHYYPQDPSKNDPNASTNEKLASWCGWHNDHGALTGLTSAMFMDQHGNEVDNPDPTAGLYVKTRSGETQHIAFPKDCLGFQIGEASQILSGGILQATPHAVMGPTNLASAGISRETLAVFMQPMPQSILTLPEGRTRDDVERGSTVEFMPEGTPALGVRYDPGVDFGTFTNRTLEHYH